MGATGEIASGPASLIEHEIGLALLSHEKIADCAVVMHGRAPGDHPAGACVRCGIPDSYPGLTMDDDGVCSLCELYATNHDAIHDYFRTVPEFVERVRSRAGDSEYDCLLLFSGGKDSTYVLHQLVNLGLRVMTFTFDNGFISRTALRNVDTITQALGIEHITAKRADQNKVFFQSLTDHKSVCNGCFRSLLDLSTQLAHERGIPSIVTGLSRGQIIDERLSWFYRQGVFDVETIERDLAVGRRIYHHIGSDTDDQALAGVEVIDYYRYSDVTKTDIRQFLAGTGQLWAQPADTGFCSSNCMINDVGVYVHNLARGFHNYEAPTRWEVRLGHLAVPDADAELRAPVNVQRVKKMLARIGYPDPASHEELGKRLAVYYVPRGEIDLAELRASVAGSLPEFLVPEHWVPMTHIPRTRGVLNIRDLPVSGQADPATRFDLPAGPPPGTLTSTQKSFVDRGFAALSRQARAVLLDLPARTDPAHARRAGLHLALRNEALRSRFVHEDGAWRRIEGAAGGVPVLGVDLSKHDPAEHTRLLRTAVDRMRARLDLGAGPLAQSALVQRTTETSQLLVVVHELAADFRTFRRLLSDLDAVWHGVGEVTDGPEPLPVSAPVRQTFPDGPSRRLPEVPAGTVLSHPISVSGKEFAPEAVTDAVSAWLGGPVAVDVADHTATTDSRRFEGSQIQVNLFGDLGELVTGTRFALADIDAVDPTVLPDTTPYVVEINVARYEGNVRMDWRCTDEMYALLVEAGVPDRVWR